MNAQDFRSLQEAYMKVYQLDEAEVIAKLGGVPGSVRVKPALSIPGTNIGIGPNRPVPGTFTTTTPEQKAKISQGNTTIDRGTYQQPRVGAGPTSNERSRYNSERLKSGQGGLMKTESLDLYDIILSYLLDEGYAETLQSAEAIMVNMGEEWRETIIEAEVLSKLDGVEGTGVGKDFKKKSWTDTEKSRYSSYKKPTAPAAKSSGDSPKASGSAQSSSSSSNVSSKPPESSNADAIAMGMSPAAYRRKQIQQAADVKSPTASADERETMYQKSQGRASEISSWYGRDPKDPKTGKAEDDYAKADYARRLAMRNNDPNYDPTKASRPTIQRAQKSSRDAWANPNAGN
jgi:hypothetical protein